MSLIQPGKLIVCPLSAHLVHDTEFFGKMSPYVKLRLNSQEYNSKVHKNGGKFPSWTDSFSFDRNGEEYLEIEVWDKEMLKSDDLVGVTKISLHDVFTKGKTHDWHTIDYKGKNAGKVLIALEFQSNAIDRSLKISQIQPQQPQQPIGRQFQFGANLVEKQLQQSLPNQQPYQNNYQSQNTASNYSQCNVISMSQHYCNTPQQPNYQNYQQSQNYYYQVQNQFPSQIQQQQSLPQNCFPQNYAQQYQAPNYQQLYPQQQQQQSGEGIKKQQSLEELLSMNSQQTFLTPQELQIQQFQQLANLQNSEQPNVQQQQQQQFDNQRFNNPII